jgi:hypothetical protein
MNCSQLYIGIDSKIPEPDSEIFSVILKPTDTDEGKKLRKLLGTKHVYYLSPHSGCGCGWEFMDVDTPYDDQSKASCERLATFLGDLEAKSVSAKLYSVCIEAIGFAPEHEQKISAAEFMAHINEYRAPYSSTVAKVYLLGT